MGAAAVVTTYATVIPVNVIERCDSANKLAIALDRFIKTKDAARGQPIASDAYAKHAQASYEFDVAKARYDLGRDR